MSLGDKTEIRRVELPADVPGSSLWQLTSGPDSHYIPYFYNPSIDQSGKRLIVSRRRGGEEQIYLVDLERSVQVQLTDAHGVDQNWAPYTVAGVNGVRPQFFVWSQPDWKHVVYWEMNQLRWVDLDTLEDELLMELPEDKVPSVQHCSPLGWIAFGYMPLDVQNHLRQGANFSDLADALAKGCGFLVYDLLNRRVVVDEATPFWPNHVSASPNHKWILFCREGPWENQRMHLFDPEQRVSKPLRVQDDGSRVGHEFWMTATEVGYHGSRDGRAFFGTIDVNNGKYVERVCIPEVPGSSCHFHTSPDNRFAVTDGTATVDKVSVGRLDGSELHLQPVCVHNWDRNLDQRFHPHPHWHSSGQYVTFTGCCREDNGNISSQVFLLQTKGGDVFAS